MLPWFNNWTFQGPLLASGNDFRELNPSLHLRDSAGPKLLLMGGPARSECKFK